MHAPRRSKAPFALLSAVLLLSSFSVPCRAAPSPAARATTGTETQETDSPEPNRSFWDLLRFRKASSDAPAEADSPADQPAEVASARQSAGEGGAASAAPRSVAKVQERLRSGAAGRDPVLRVLLDRIDRGQPRAADLSAVATHLARKGMVQDAITYQQEAVRVDRQSPTLWLNLGTLQRDLGRSSAAMSSYRKALDLDPNHALAHYNVGTLLDAQGDYDGAVEEYRTALMLDPSLADPVKNPQVVNNERLMVVSLLLYRQKAGALGLPLVAVPGVNEPSSQRSTPATPKR